MVGKEYVNVNPWEEIKEQVIMICTNMIDDHLEVQSGLLVVINVFSIIDQLKSRESTYQLKLEATSIILALLTEIWNQCWKCNSSNSSK